MRNHRTSLSHLSFVERRSIDRHQQFGAQLDQLVSWIVCIKSFTPECLVVPEVFTDRNSDFAVIDKKQLAFSAGLKVTRIVKDVVLRKKSLVGKTKELLVA